MTKGWGLLACIEDSIEAFVAFFSRKRSKKRFLLPKTLSNQLLCLVVCLPFQKKRQNVLVPSYKSIQWMKMFPKETT
jgi:hypothetical protein